MFFPHLQELERYRETTDVFGGYNHRLSCSEGQFFDMKNMTAKYYPILSPRPKRGIVHRFVNPQGLLDKDDLWWVDDSTLYRNGKKVTLNNVNLFSGEKMLTKMGAYIVIMPDKVWVNTNTSKAFPECGYMENTVNLTGVSFSTCDSAGNRIEWHNAEYYQTTTPNDGDYMMSANSEGKPSLKVYSGTTGIWMNVVSAYTKISATGIGKGFSTEDGVKISARLFVSEEETTTGETAVAEETTPTDLGVFSDILVNKEGDTYFTNTYIIHQDEDGITIPGIYKATSDSGVDTYSDVTFRIERKVPDMSFVTECNNRLWGSSRDGHEIYCSKLGDVKNWNCFRGNSTDSWAATVGSDGKFTGAITYLGYPMFFKEDSLIKIIVSSVGGHQIKETKCRGVQSGSEKSLSVLNEILYYKSTTGVCGYNGSLPYGISDDLGDVTYYRAVAGSIHDKYYISMEDAGGKSSLFVYDVKKGIWCKEDNTKALVFCRHQDDLYLIDHQYVMKSVGGTILPYGSEKQQEKSFDWLVESGVIGYSSPDNKYVGRINIRITLEFGTNVDFYLQYDSNGEWEHKFNMSGQGTRTYSIPVIPKRCDHFKYKIAGNGDCKIHSVTKTIEEGSDG